MPGFGKDGVVDLMDGLGLPLVPLAVDDAGPLVISDNAPYRKAKPGETLKIRLLAVGVAPRAAMAHNFVVLEAGTNQIAFADAAAKAVATDYIPAALRNQILAATTLKIGRAHV